MYKLLEQIENGMAIYPSTCGYRYQEMLEWADDVGITTIDSVKRQFVVKDERNTNSPLRLSALGYPAMELVCRQFFPLIRHEEESCITPKMRRIFYEGDTFEGLMNFILRSIGYKILDTQRTVEWNGVLGHTDSIVIDPDGSQWLLEFKSMNDKKFKRIQKGGMDIPEYRTQLATYMDATGLPGAWICYNKNNSELMVIVPTLEELRPELRRAKYVVDKFREIEKFEDAFRFFRTPPVEPRYRQNQIVGYQVPQSMYWSKYNELLYHTRPMKFFTAVDEPYYKTPSGLADAEGLVETWIQKDKERYGQ